LKSLLSDAEKKDIKILAISMDSHDDSRKMIYATEKPDYPGPFDLVLLSDPQHKTIDTYGVYNPHEEQFDDKTNSFKESGIPYPITYIIGKDGKVASRLFDQVQFERPTNAQVRSELIRVGAIKN
jgi:peroxiredoxin